MSVSARDRNRTHEPTVFSLPSAVENQVTRVFRAPIERVYGLFTDPATLPYIFGPDPNAVTVEKLDLRKGGRYSVAVKNEDGSTWRFHGEFREVDPPRRVVNTAEIDAFPGKSWTETDVFEPVGDFTRVTVRWTYESQEDRDKMVGPQAEQAFTAMWDKIEVLLDKVVP